MITMKINNYEYSISSSDMFLRNDRIGSVMLMTQNKSTSLLDGTNPKLGKATYQQLQAAAGYVEQKSKTYPGCTELRIG